MKLSRIDLVAQNGNDGQHYKYEEVAEYILTAVFGAKHASWCVDEKKDIVKILVENFPDD